MRALWLLFLATILPGCTTTAARITGNPVSLTIESAKTPQALANCLADTMTGANLRSDGTHYWIVRENGYGTIGRWDVYPSGSGSRAEWRRVSGLTTGGGAGSKCA